MPTKQTFHFRDIDMPEVQEGQVLLNSLYISVDPYMRGRMRDVESYVEPFKLNEPISGGVVAAVIVSDYSNRFKEGIKKLVQWYNAGELQHKETARNGFDNIPAAFIGLFSGGNIGKQVVKVANAGKK